MLSSHETATGSSFRILRLSRLIISSCTCSLPELTSSTVPRGGDGQARPSGLKQVQNRLTGLR